MHVLSSTSMTPFVVILGGFLSSGGQHESPSAHMFATHVVGWELTAVCTALLLLGRLSTGIAVCGGSGGKVLATVGRWWVVGGADTLCACTGAGRAGTAGGGCSEWLWLCWVATTPTVCAGIAVASSSTPTMYLARASSRAARNMVSWCSLCSMSFTADANDDRSVICGEITLAGCYSVFSSVWVSTLAIFARDAADAGVVLVVARVLADEEAEDEEEEEEEREEGWCSLEACTWEEGEKAVAVALRGEESQACCRFSGLCTVLGGERVGHVSACSPCPWLLLPPFRP